MHTQSTNKQLNCLLCEQTGGEMIWSDASCRVVDAQDVTYPGLTRVIWQDHVAEMTDLEVAARQHLMKVVLIVEDVMRQQLEPQKVNLASLGNQVPHLHWHIIPRWSDDATFPDPIWAAIKREDEKVVARRKAIETLLPSYHLALQQRLAMMSSV